jgi:Stage II sporulation protein E (SpoIIE)
VAELDCSVLEFRMAESDRLLLLSDGVAEATNVKGELFGFERVLELVRTRPPGNSDCGSRADSRSGRRHQRDLSDKSAGGRTRDIVNP